MNQLFYNICRLKCVSKHAKKIRTELLADQRAPLDYQATRTYIEFDCATLLASYEWIGIEMKRKFEINYMSQEERAEPM